MSATTQPLAGQHKSAAPFGAVALIAGVLALGAIGIALMQGSKATPVAGAVPADVQSALLVQRMGEKASLFPAGDARLIQHQGELADRLGAYATSDPRLVQHLGELQDRAAAAVAGSIIDQNGLIFGRAPVTYGSIVTSDGRIFGRPRAIAIKPAVRSCRTGGIVPLGPTAGPKSAAQKGLARPRRGRSPDPSPARWVLPTSSSASLVLRQGRDALGSATFTPATSYAGKVQDSIGAASITRFPGKALDDAVVAATTARSPVASGTTTADPPGATGTQPATPSGHRPTPPDGVPARQPHATIGAPMHLDERFDDLVASLAGFHQAWLVYLGLELGLVAELRAIGPGRHRGVGARGADRLPPGGGRGLGLGTRTRTDWPPTRTA